MVGKTSIEWTHAPGYVGGVWNPTTGCTRVSAGCDNCYAFTLHDRRYKANLDAVRDHGQYEGMKPAEVRAHVDLNIEQGDIVTVGEYRDLFPFPKQYDLPFSRVQLLPDRLDVPLRTKKPTCYFVDSMADLFHEDVPDEYLDRVFATMELVAATRHRFLVLTKRPERMRAYLTRRWGEAGGPYARGEAVYQPEHIWLGTSVGDQKAADERIPHLLATPAAVRFLSCEPLLGPVSLDTDHLGDVLRSHRPLGVMPGATAEPTTRIDWVILGGESGPRARPMDLSWARSLIEQCRAAGVACFVKQDSGPRPGMQGRIPDEMWIKEWPRG